MKLLNDSPNFSIVLPGGCNAKCPFCFAGQDTKVINLVGWMRNLNIVLANLPKEFFQISITGNEPMLSPYLEPTLATIALYKQKYTNILLTTNGTNLIERGAGLVGVVDHVNISRHHYDEAENNKIFGGTYAMTDAYTEDAIDKFGSAGIDVSVNCVIDDETTKDFIDKFILFARNIGFKAIRFRKKNGTNEPVTVEKEFADYAVAWEGTCPVCMNRKRIIKGMEVYWKTSVVEPNTVTDGKIFELVFRQDGQIYSDWEGKNKVDIASLATKKKSDVTQQLSYPVYSIPPLMPQTYSVSTSCGGSGCGYRRSSHC